MRFLSNIYNPNKSDAKFYIACYGDETLDEAWEYRQKWLKGKIIGKPQATMYYSIEELEKMGMVGIYTNESENQSY